MLAPGTWFVVLSRIEGSIGPADTSQVWSGREVAVELRPVRNDFAGSWRDATLDEMAGRDASSHYREPLNAMDVRWRLTDAGSELEPMTEGQKSQMLDLALVGAGMGFRDALTTVMTQSDEMRIIHRVVETATGPALEIRPGSTQVLRVDDGSPSRAALLASVEEGGSGKETPSFKVGSGLRLVEEVDTGTYHPAWGAFWQVNDLGADLLRFETTFVPEDPEAPFLTAPSRIGGWGVLARQDLSRTVALHADVRGVGLEPEPRMLRGGVSTALPVESRLLARTNLARIEDPEVGVTEWVAEVALQTRLRWHAPKDAIAAWPEPRSAPIELAPFGQTPAERHSDTEP